MKNTKNYKMIIPDGSDYVNPLTQVNPNFETIDRVMYDNQKGSLRTVHNVTKSGDSFTVTLDNVATQYFKFVAPADYEKGDTISINTKTFAPIDQSGKELESKAFVGGAVVICYLSSSDPCTDTPCKPEDLTNFDLLTVLANTGTGGGGGGTADNALKLGGQPPEYYAKQSDLSTLTGQVGTLSTEVTTVKQTATGNKKVLDTLTTTVKKIEVVTSLPGSPDASTMYLIRE